MCSGPILVSRLANDALDAIVILMVSASLPAHTSLLLMGTVSCSMLPTERSSS
jgi:hypothetical protein